MDKEQIIQMARDAGLLPSWYVPSTDYEKVKSFYNMARAATKEEDAKICDLIEEKNTRQGPADCAVAIRASK